MPEKISEIGSMVVQMTGHGHTILRHSLDAGKPAPEAEEIRVQKALEDERKKVQPIYNSKGEIIEYDQYGRHLDITA